MFRRMLSNVRSPKQRIMMALNRIDLSHPGMLVSRALKMELVRMSIQQFPLMILSREIHST
jgi:hypothetical protein